MRKNGARALDGWHRRTPARPADSIWTDGERILSYDTCLVEREADGRVLLNVTHYSQTTTVHQGALSCALPYALPVTGVPIGTRADLARFIVHSTGAPL